MENVERFIMRSLNRAFNGAYCAQDDWDFRIIPENAAEALAAFGITGAYDKSCIVNSDETLADAFFKAGLQVAVRTGMYCVSTERRILFSEEEITEALSALPESRQYGTGRDRFTRVCRRPSDGKRPMNTAIIGTPVSEDLYEDVVKAIAEIPEVDSISGPTLETVDGEPVIAETPFESLAGKREAILKNRAVDRAGRSGMPLTATETSPTAYGLLSSVGMEGGFKPERDVVSVLGLAELKTSFEQFHKAVHAAAWGMPIRGGQPAMLGGYGGGAEAAALLNIALTILQHMVYGAEYGGGNILDVRYQGNCGRAAMWSQSVTNQALTRNSRLLTDPLAFQVAGPNTDMLLYESAVGHLVSSCCGGTGTMLPYSSGGTKTDYITPLETKFCAEVMIAGAGMSPQAVDTIARELIPRYEDQLMNPPEGESIRTCYDLETMTPKDDWMRKYETVKAELIQMGVPFTTKEET